MGADSKSVHIFIAEIEVSELYIHIYYISKYNEFENSWNYIEQGFKQGFNLDVIIKLVALIPNMWLDLSREATFFSNSIIYLFNEF